jgi:non-specific serine/threonine protein kinase
MMQLGLGACLADDMGLGKTIQVIDLLLRLRSGADPRPDAAAGGSERHRPQHSLLIVPASLIGNWKQELARFAPQLKAVFAHRSECDAGTLDRIAQNPAKALAGFDLVVTTYALVRKADWISRHKWRLIVLDEAQAIKNAGSTQTRAVKTLTAAGRIVLTGTPIENQLGDLWSLFDFCSPGLLGSAKQFKDFVKRLDRRQDAHAYGALRRLVQPYILRRLKTDPHIVPDLPAKTEMRAECGLSKKQAALYQQIVDDLAAQLKAMKERRESDGIQRRGIVLAAMMRLKQVCNHPSQYLAQPAFAPGESGKFARLAAICEPVADRQEKMLVFTQFQSICEPLAQYLGEVFGRTGLVLHGGVPVGRRKELVRRFQEDDAVPYFVISVKAGGTGLNLTAASHVVHFDRWWNPAVENQATDRAFRIGQKRNVLVHKFVCRGTLEERIDEMIRQKQELADEVLGQTGEGEKLLTEMSDRELLNFVALDITRASDES